MRFFTLLISLLFSLLLSAQSIESFRNEGRAFVPSSGDGLYWYQYCNDTIRGSVGSTPANSPIRVSVKIPQSRCAQLNGYSIEQIAFGCGLVMGEEYRVFVSRNPMTDDFVYAQRVYPSIKDTLGWFQVVLDEPVQIDGSSDLYVGCECVPYNDSEYPSYFGVDMYSSNERDNINTVNIWDQTKQEWGFVPNYTYNLSLKVGISGDVLPEYDLSVVDCSLPAYVLAGEEFDATVTVKNYGMDTLRCARLTYTIDGKESVREISNLSVAPLHLFDISVSGLSFSQAGLQNIEFVIEEEGRQDFTPDDNRRTFEVNVTEQGLARTVLVDELLSGTETDMSAFHAMIEDSLKILGLYERVIWVEHHSDDEFDIKGDKSNWFFDSNSYLFYPAFMVDCYNFRGSGATIPTLEGTSTPSPTPLFQYEDGNLFDFISERLNTPTYISCKYVNTSEKEDGDNKVYGFKLEVEQMANATIPQLRYVMVLLQNGRTDSQNGFVWNRVPVEYYGDYADSWGNDLTLTENRYESGEIFVTVPSGKESEYTLVAYVYNLSADKNSMSVENATSYPLGLLSSVESVSASHLYAWAVDNRIVVSPDVTNVKVYNVSGCQVFGGDAASLENLHFDSGIYIVSMSDGQSEETTKVLIH